MIDMRIIATQEFKPNGVLTTFMNGDKELLPYCYDPIGVANDGEILHDYIELFPNDKIYNMFKNN
jgi:hypothetical protein